MRLPNSRLKLTLLTTLAVFLGAIAICQVFEWLGFPEQDQVKKIKELKDMAGWNSAFILVVVQVLFVVPPFEELLFRYLLFRFPSRLVSKDEPSQLFVLHPSFFIAVISSVLFSFCHYIDFGLIIAGRGFALLPISNAFLALFFVGLAWCWLYQRSKSIWCSMLSHSIFNSVNFALALLI